MAKPDRRKATVARVMDEFKHGELTANGGRKVRNPKQAIAIALSEAGASNRQTPAQNRRRAALTQRAEDLTGETRAALYRQAAERGIAGRSRMTKAELVRALAH